jgi:hypothetical protein
VVPGGADEATEVMPVAEAGAITREKSEPPRKKAARREEDEDDRDAITDRPEAPRKKARRDEDEDRTERRPRVDPDEDEEDDRKSRKGKKKGKKGKEEPGDYKPCPQCGAEGATRVLWTPWGSFYGPAMFCHVKCPDCGHTYNGRTGGSNLIPAIICVVIPLLLILAILGGIVYIFYAQGYFGDSGKSRRRSGLQLPPPLVCEARERVRAPYASMSPQARAVASTSTRWTERPCPSKRPGKKSPKAFTSRT